MAATKSMSCTSSTVTPMLTDLYQISMAYAYFNCGRHEETAVFDLFFRKCPFKGEICVFAGLDECLKFIHNYGFKPEEIDFLQKQFPHWNPSFFEYLANIDCTGLKVWAQEEGSLVFPRVPLLRVEGPLIVGQLLETTLLNLTNYASLVATNGLRHRIAAGPEKKLLEFGLRRAQGPDGSLSASKYSYIGGFDGTSNVQAGFLFGIPIKGTHAHSYITSFTSLDQVPDCEDENLSKLKELSLDFRHQLLEKGISKSTNNGELAAFITYALAYPKGTLCLVDTYDTLGSGCVNYLAVALALHTLGLKAVGIRLDSGDLAYLSKKCREMFCKVIDLFPEMEIQYFEKFNIVASNDIHEDVLYSLNTQGHEIDSFGIGTHLVTCKKQPALGCVYKLVDVNGAPRIKFSQDSIKMTIPGKKNAYRLYGGDGLAIIDLLVPASDGEIKAGDRVLCRHPFSGRKRAFVVPTKVKPLLNLVWDGELVNDIPDINESKARCVAGLKELREDHIRHQNPTPYKVSVTDDLYNLIIDLWQEEVPVPELN